MDYAKELAKMFGSKLKIIESNIPIAGLSLEEVSKRCRVEEHPDGSQTYYWDSKPILMFGPLEVFSGQENGKILFKLEQKFRILSAIAHTDERN